MNLNMGIEEKDSKKIVDGMSLLLADTFFLYMKTHNFHWNVEGPQFTTLHQMFMAQYTELWNALDTIAERIRALGSYAPGTYKVYSSLSSIPESDKNRNSNEMIEELLHGHEIVIKTIRQVYPVADSSRDMTTVDLLTQRLQVHEKTAWMLRSLLVNKS